MRRIALPLAVVAVSIAALGSSYYVANLRTTTHHSWWSNALTGFGITLLLIIPGTMIGTRLQSIFEQSKQASNQAVDAAEAAQQSANDAKALAEETAMSLEQVRDALIAQQDIEHQDHLDVYEQLRTAPTRDALIAALKRAADEDIISDTFVLSRVWHTHLYYRFITGVEEGTLDVQLVTLDGNVLSVHRWEPGETAIEFCGLLAQAVRDAGADLGPGLNLPSESIDHLAGMLVKAANMRAPVLSGYRDTLRKIVKMDSDGGRDNAGWFFTETTLLPAKDPGYVVDYNRLADLDWIDHLRGKGWLGVERAVEEAQTLATQFPQPRLREAELADEP